MCIGMPGTLPVLNKKAVEFAVAVGLAMDCTITKRCKFDRKNYFYPDLPKAYQISQFYLPICRNGKIGIETDSGKKKIGIHEIHLEEDAGKLIHDPSKEITLIDYNRCVVPGHSNTDWTTMCIGIASKLCSTATENFCFCRKLNMHFKPNHRFIIFHFSPFCTVRSYWYAVCKI